MKLILFIFLLLAFSLASARDWSVLQKVEWERDADTVKPYLITIHFTFKDAPNYYPVFFEENPAVLRIVFSGTQLDSELTEARTVPPPLTSFNVFEQRLAKGEPVTQINLGLDKKCPFTAKRQKDVITLTLDVTGLIRESRLIVSHDTASEGTNRVKNILVQETSNNVEILLSLESPPPAFSAYVLDSAPRLIVDLPGVFSDSAAPVREINMPPVCSLKTVAKVNFTRLVFTLSKMAEVKTLQRGSRLSLLLPREKSMMERNKRWVYLSASALLLGGVGGAVMLMGGEEAGKTAPDQPPATDDWRTRPPHPGEIPQ